MQNSSPRQYFETRLRQLPVYKCLVNEDWEEEKMANVMVLRSHVNGHVSGSNFLVDLLCLGVKDATWFFNTDPDELTKLAENADPPMVEIPYPLAHNIVYAGLEFAAEYDIKPHADFAIARYVLEDDDDSIELIDIETGEDGVPHLMERHPGQYADAHRKLMKNAGPGNFKISLVFENEEEADEIENSWRREEEEEEDWEEEEEEEEDEISLKDIDINDLSVYDAMMLPNEDLVNTELIATRSELEQMKISLERLVRIYDKLSVNPGFVTQTLGMDESVNDEIARIHELTDENFVGNLPYPNGCDAEGFEQGLKDFFSMIAKIPECTTEEKEVELTRLLQTSYRENPLVLAHCIFYLLVDGDGPALFETLQPYLHALRQYPMVALAQTFLVTADPEIFPHTPLLTAYSHMLQDVCHEYPQFSDDEYTLFYALRTLQAAKQKNIPLMATWYRLMATTDEADIYLGMFVTLYMHIMEGAEGFLEQVGERAK